MGRLLRENGLEDNAIRVIHGILLDLHRIRQHIPLKFKVIVVEGSGAVNTRLQLCDHSVLDIGRTYAAAVAVLAYDNNFANRHRRTNGAHVIIEHVQDGLNEELEVVLSHTVSQNCFGTGLNVHVIQTILNNAETAHRTVFVFRHLFVSLAFIIRGNAATSIGNSAFCALILSIWSRALIAAWIASLMYGSDAFLFTVL